jgi:hypothetical protein
MRNIPPFIKATVRTLVPLAAVCIFFVAGGGDVVELTKTLLGFAASCAIVGLIWS